MAKRVGNKQLVFRTQRGLSWCCSLVFFRGKTTTTTTKQHQQKQQLKKQQKKNHTTKAKKGLPTSDFEFQRPTSAFLLPTSDFRLPTSDFRLPTSNFQKQNKKAYPLLPASTCSWYMYYGILYVSECLS